MSTLPGPGQYDVGLKLLGDTKKGPSFTSGRRTDFVRDCV